MKLIIDDKKKILKQDIDGRCEEFPLYSKKSFELISHWWMKLGWNQKYEYTFSWLGRPIIQLPEDMVRMQEIIYSIKPDLIIETGIAHGGSLIFYAGLCELVGKGHVIGIDIEIRPHNRAAIENHKLFPLITLVEGSSTDQKIVDQVRQMIQHNETVMVILDSCHTKQHVRDEMKAYSGMVSPGSYLVVTDGVMQDLFDVPNGEAEWKNDNPQAATYEFLAQNNDFILEEPSFLFNESELTERITHWPNAFLKRKNNIS